MNRIERRMNRAAAVAAIVTVCGVLAACNQAANADAVKYADVTAVKPLTKTIKTPRQVCKDVTVSHRQEPRDKHEILGTTLGAVIGGVVGNQVGGGDGKKLATVAGAVAGGYAGKKIQERHEKPAVTTTTERRCHTVTDTSTKVIGYDVTYVYNGVTGHARMDHKPGARLPVRQGIVAVDAAQ